MVALLADRQGWTIEISLPLLAVGRHVVLSTLAMPRLVIPLQSPLGEMTLQVAVAARA